MASIKFNNIYLKDWLTIAGPLESNSKLKKIDYKMNDYYYGESTFEKTEAKMQSMVIENLLIKNKLIKNITNKGITYTNEFKYKLVKECNNYKKFP